MLCRIGVDSCPLKRRILIGRRYSAFAIASIALEPDPNRAMVSRCTVRDEPNGEFADSLERRPRELGAHVSLPRVRDGRRLRARRGSRPSCTGRRTLQGLHRPAKPNGYRGQHTSVGAADRSVFEVQTRSIAMNVHVEEGSAAHADYKDATWIPVHSGRDSPFKRLLAPFGARQHGRSEREAASAECVCTPRWSLWRLACRCDWYHSTPGRGCRYNWSTTLHP